MEISGEADFARLLELEEEYIRKMCGEVLALKPDLVFTEKGVSGKKLKKTCNFTHTHTHTHTHARTHTNPCYAIFACVCVCVCVCFFSDLAQHFLMKNNVSVIRRVRKSDNNRIAKYV